MPRQERDARALCATYGVDPDEMVWGYWQANGRERISAPRWCWYVGGNPCPL